ncbi:MAG TPA: V-type ATP synthase subunit E family protein [Candidatus Angelobacter sp.]|nr:V-type ATP synthase subunit E family protein [Candidatus Angelobacter sp.]
MSESLEKLQNRILSDARLKGEETTREAQAKAEQILEEARRRAQKESEEVIAKAKVDAESVRRSILSSKVRVNRLRILDEKNRIVQDIIHAVEDQLSSIARTDQFENTAQRFVTEAVKAVESDQPVVRIGFRDATKKNLDGMSRVLPKGGRLVIDEKPIDEFGGVIATDPEGRVVFNNTFKSRLERLDNQLLTLISSTIFGE